MIPQYIFTIDNGNGLGQYVAHPVWKDDLSLNYAYESNQYFRRAQLSGDLTFVGQDYDYIIGTDFGATFSLEVQVSYAAGSWQIFWEGEFHITDCTINVDDRSVKVKPSVKDKYSKILSGLDKEYDLIKLKPEIQPVTTTRRPMIQVYVPGDPVVTCYLSGMSWEQDAQETDDIWELVGTYRFAVIGWFFEVTVLNPPIQTLTNTFVWEGEKYGNDALLNNGQGAYKVRFLGFSGGESCEVRVVSANDLDTTLWYYEGETKDGVTLTSQRQGVADLTANLMVAPILARLCLANKTYRGADTYPIPQDDIVPYNRNFRYCVPLTVSDSVIMSNGGSEQPTEWGVRPDGKYYQMPAASTPVIRYMPVARSLWGYASAWLSVTSTLEQMEVDGRKETYLRDAFTLEAVIMALLKEIDPEITFYASQVYSRFLFGQNPLMQIGWGRLVMTPKSNILVAEYTQPARKAPITLGKVLNMLRDVCGCYWYLNDSKQLIIEHISWFKNGGSYSGTQAIGIDITVAENTRNGKMLSFGTNEFSYDKLEMPERYEYQWADDTTDAFKGSAIDVLSSYVEQGKVEEVNIDGFNADLDYMMLNPSGVSEDGFALMCCSYTNGQYRTQIDHAYYTNQKIQNWQLSMQWLQEVFLISDMPSWQIMVNGRERTALGIQRKKTQKVNIPVGHITPNMQTLIRTGIGVGEIKDMDIRLTSRTAKTTIVYDTTEQ